MDKHQPTISFSITNSEQLESGYLPSATLTQHGGLIGSGNQCDWKIQDCDGAISASQYTVFWKDQHFCLKVNSDSVYINNAIIPLHLDAVKLTQGDQIRVGKLVITTNISLTGQPIQNMMAATPQSIVAKDHNPLDSLFDIDTTSSEGKEYPFVPTVQGALTADPLQALENENLSLISKNQSAISEPSLLSDPLSYSPAFAISDNKENTMVQEFIDLPKITPFEDEHMTDIDHVAINPLMNGLGIHLNLTSSQQANDFLIELGKTMKAAVEGLLALQQQQESLQDKQLRPIEDNPLRLNSSYEDTMKLMFTDERSPVHLSAPSAVTESLHNMQLHYHANQEAISTALATMLAAFSPEHLLNRFSQYRRASDNTPMTDGWAWEMYSNYYKELSSSRQQGFEKLFYEVYAHAYDRALRKGIEEA
ncbi:type VI secretion system-associated FHA domain protein TagH [Providencia sp. Me31A]|uniref:type VI secretion system-associated FHA domain protein TagH n=1 Tax=Providencia sp. Me31A TaxID=3392637 RepID=UPI003D284294